MKRPRPIVLAIAILLMAWFAQPTAQAQYCITLPWCYGNVIERWCTMSYCQECAGKGCLHERMYCSATTQSESAGCCTMYCCQGGE